MGLSKNFVAERRVRLQSLGAPRHHEYPLDIGDTITLWGNSFVVTVMLFLSNPVREVKLTVQEVPDEQG